MAGEGELRGRTGLGPVRSLHRRRGRGPRPSSRDARGRDDRTGRGGTQTLCGATIGVVSEPAPWCQAGRFWLRRTSAGPTSENAVYRNLAALVIRVLR